MLAWYGRPIPTISRCIAIKAFLLIFDATAHGFIAFGLDSAPFIAVRPRCRTTEAMAGHSMELKIGIRNSDDFSDTAHLVRQLDLVISVDTAVAHLGWGS